MNFYVACFLFLWSFSSFAGMDTLYLTWQRDPTTTITIQWLEETTERAPHLVEWRKMKQEGWQEGHTLPIPSPATHLVLHRIELKNLTPGTTYQFRRQGQEEVYAFHTLSSSPISLKCVIGGDVYHDQLLPVAKTCRQAAAQEPDFAVLGGDIAYTISGGPSSKERPERWREWLKTWSSTMRGSQNRLIPVVGAIGNHDTVGQFDQTLAQASWFLLFFPKSSGTTSGLLQIDSFLSLWLLDSGHAQSVPGEQTVWLEETLRQNPSTLHKVAVYHVPAYPAIRRFDHVHSQIIRKNWVPLFEKYHLHVAFEHHDHAYKRSHLLWEGRPSPKGVLYLGDGAWGVSRPRRPSFFRRPPYLQKILAERHFIVAEFSQTTRSYTAMDDQGRILDHFSQDA